MRFEIKNKKFLINGKPIKIISGAVHYFRNMPDTWPDIFDKMRALGCNTVETYCAWNMHEKHPGEYDFEGILNITEFIRTAQEHNLFVILRPGPYICAEWEFGGLPWWIQNDKDIEIRCSNRAYMLRLKKYLERLFGEIRPLLISNGGPIIMVQCENEYGYYGDDKRYLTELYHIFREFGIDVPIFTSDGISEQCLLDGTIDGCLATLNFGSRAEGNFSAHSKMFPDYPKMCMECWNGWFDGWGDEKHHTTSAEKYAEVVDSILDCGSINMYMFIGGTNFGFTNGANHDDKYRADVTSYDYDALLTECGDVTPKYIAVREIIKKHIGGELPRIPPNRKKAAYGKVKLTKSANLFDNLENLSDPQYSNVPKCMEDYGGGYGYVLYTTKLNRDYRNAELSFERIGDRAHVYINGKQIGTVYVNDHQLKVKFDAKMGDTLFILCENMGRVNFGSKMMGKKGIVGRCLLDGKVHFGWNTYLLPMENLSGLRYGKTNVAAPVFYKGEFEIDEACDTFLRTDYFTKGFVMLNGFNLGRYWETGPQKTLYVPKSILKKGKNEIIVFENDAMKGEPMIEFVDKPDLG